MNICYIGGCGRLGLPLAAWSAYSGYGVTCVDVDQDRVDAVNNGTVKTMEPLVAHLVHDFHVLGLVATTDPLAVPNAEITFIIVPTPSRENGSFSIKHVLDACKTVGGYVGDDYHVVVVVSTVNPGDMECYIAPALAEYSGKEIGTEVGLVYSPEFIAQGSIIHDFTHPAQILIGQLDERSGDVAQEYYESVTENDPPIHRMSLASAEIAKIGLNTAVTAKLAVANQLAWLCHFMPGADAKDVLGAVGSDPRIGGKCFSAGTPDGGPCFPRDGRALMASSKRFNLPLPLAEATDAFRQWQVSLVCWAIGSYMKIFERTSPIVLGLTYKPGVDITEESAGVAVYQAILDAKAPYSPDSYDPALDTERTLEQAIADRDFLIITTPWPEFKELETLNLEGKIIFDMWSMLDTTNCDKYIRFGKGETTWTRQESS